MARKLIMQCGKVILSWLKLAPASGKRSEGNGRKILIYAFRMVDFYS